MALGRDLEITWLGHGTFKIVSPGGKHILLDAWVQSNPSCPEHLKTLDRVDLILISHGHFDHTDDCLAIARQTGAKVISNYEISHWLNSQGIENTADMNKGGTQTWEGIQITMVHAEHSSSIVYEGQLIYGGEPVGFVIEFENGFKLYHAGDTALFGDMRLIGELYQPDMAILPIGDHYTMAPREAAYAIRLLEVKQVLGGHYGTFPVLDGTPDQMREYAKDVAGLTVFELQPGETLK